MTRRTDSSSYKAKYENLRAVRVLTDGALDRVEQQRNLIVIAGNQAQTSVTASLHRINSLLNIPRNTQWVADEDGHMLVHESTAIQHNQTLVADAKNVELGIKLLGDVISGYDRALEFLLEHIEELSDAMHDRSMIGHQDLTDIEEPLGLRNADQPPIYEPPPPTFDGASSSSGISSAHVPSPTAHSVIPINSSASVFSAFGTVSFPATAHTPLFVNTEI